MRACVRACVCVYMCEGVGVRGTAMSSNSSLGYSITPSNLLATLSLILTKTVSNSRLILKTELLTKKMCILKTCIVLVFTAVTNYPFGEENDSNGGTIKIVMKTKVDKEKVMRNLGRLKGTERLLSVIRPLPGYIWWQFSTLASNHIFQCIFRVKRCQKIWTFWSWDKKYINCKVRYVSIASIFHKIDSGFDAGWDLIFHFEKTLEFFFKMKSIIDKMTIRNAGYPSHFLRNLQGDNMSTNWIFWISY